MEMKEREPNLLSLFQIRLPPPQPFPSEDEDRLSFRDAVVYVIGFRLLAVSKTLAKSVVIQDP